MCSSDLALVLLRFPTLDTAARRERIRAWAGGMLRAMGVRLEVAGHMRPGAKLVVANHVAYWDSLLAIALVTHLLRLDGYALMEARSLDLHPYLGRAGGFGVERDAPGDGEAVIAYGAGRLDRPGRVVWVYPEGQIGRAHV